MNRKRREAKSTTSDPSNRYAPLAVCVGLVLAVAVVFGETTGHDFVNFDDDQYVYENPHVTRGLTAEGIGSAMTTGHAANWHPLTWLSHMADCQLYGLNAGQHHLTSLLLHAATAVLLFLLLRRMTGDLWPSAFVAAVWAVHPLRVESVAWVAERKDVLSGLFFMLTLWAYVEYVRRPFSWARYLSVAALFALGLMAKPMLVTLPFVLLLLDYWPLGRFPTSRVGKPSAASHELPTTTWAQENATAAQPVSRLLVEKVPLLLLAACSCVVTFIVQRPALAHLDKLPLASRMANAVVSYAAYLGEFFYPADLAVLYPCPSAGRTDGQVAAALLVLAGVSAAVFAFRRRMPCLPVGWLWYLGMLVPVIGLVQVGSQAMADRYTYLPQIGLCIALAWGVMHLTAAWPNRRWALGIASAAALAALMVTARHQATFWCNSTTLWTRALECTAENSTAHVNLGKVLQKQGSLDKAIEHYNSALEIQPNCAAAYCNLGAALTTLKQSDQAIRCFERALEIQPSYVDAHVNFGEALAQQGRFAEAAAQYQQALQTDGNCVEAHYNLGIAYARQNQLDDALAQYEQALKINPNLAEAQSNLGGVLVTLGRVEQALPHFQRALEIRPSYVGAYINFGMALVKLGQIDEAIAQYMEALKVDPQCADAHARLGVALQLCGQIDGALRHYRTALALAIQQGNGPLAEDLKARLQQLPDAGPSRR